MSFDFDGKNWAIRIIFTIDMMFFAIAILMSLGLRPETRAMGQKVWEVFMGANGALFLLLNAEGKKGIDVPTDNDTQTTVQQSVTATTTSTPPPVDPPKEGV